MSDVSWAVVGFLVAGAMAISMDRPDVLGRWIAEVRVGYEVALGKEGHG